jgi:hypothetical protein
MQYDSGVMLSRFRGGWWVTTMFVELTLQYLASIFDNPSQSACGLTANSGGSSRHKLAASTAYDETIHLANSCQD